MLPDLALEKLKQNLDFCFEESYDNSKGNFLPASDKHKDFYSKNIGVKKISSAFIDYYSIIAFPPKGQGEELYTFDEILEAKEEGDEELPPEIGKTLPALYFYRR